MRKILNQFKKRIILCILIAILCNPCFILCYSPNEVNKLEDYIFLGYVYEADVMNNETSLYNRNFTETVVEDHLAAGGYREEIDSFNLTYVRQKGSIFNVTIRMNYLNYTFCGSLLFNEETYRYYDPELGEAKGCFHPFIIPIDWERYPVVTSRAGPGLENYVDSYGYRDDITLQSYTPPLSNDWEFILKFQHNPENAYLHTYKVYIQQPFGSGDIRISHFNHIWIRLGWFYGDATTRFFTLARMNLTSGLHFTLAYQLWHTNLDLWSSEAIINRLDVEAPADGNGNYWGVVSMVMMLGIPALLTYFFVRAKQTSSKSKKKLPPRNQKYRRKHPRV